MVECSLCRETVSPDRQCRMAGQIYLRKCEDKLSTLRLKQHKFLMYLSSNFGKLYQYLSKLCLLSVLQQHVIQNAKMVGSASDLENADVHQAMGVDTVIKVSKTLTSDSLEIQGVWKQTKLIWDSWSPRSNALWNNDLNSLDLWPYCQKMPVLEDLHACRRMGWSICTEMCCESLRKFCPLKNTLFMCYVNILVSSITDSF